MGAIALKTVLNGPSFMLLYKLIHEIPFCYSVYSYSLPHHDASAYCDMHNQSSKDKELLQLQLKEFLHKIINKLDF